MPLTLNHPASAKTARRPQRAARTQDRSVETRGKLVAAAIQGMSELGYTGATTPIIARRAGVTRGALQYHFAAREDLDVAVIDHVITELNFRLDVDALAGAPLPARVQALIDAYWRGFASPIFRAALNIWLEMSSAPKLAKRLRDHLAARQDRIDRAWLTLFEDTGRTREELQTIRRLVMSTLRGLAVGLIFTPSATGERERALLRELTLQALRNPALHRAPPKARS